MIRPPSLRVPLNPEKGGHVLVNDLPLAGKVAVEFSNFLNLKFVVHDSGLLILTLSARKRQRT
jgi:ssDNA-specific exonuclease RecJ